MPRRGGVCFWLVVILCLCVAPAPAHPLGNFTINHLARITATRDGINVRYVLDIAEIPTFQIMHARGNGPWTSALLQSWASDETPEVQSAFRVAIDGKPATLVPRGATAALRAGAGGLPILRWVGEFALRIGAQSSAHIAIDDEVYADRRIGWKDIVISNEAEPTNELQRYPSALIGTPRRIKGVRFTFEDGRILRVARSTDGPVTLGATQSWISATALSELFARPNQTPLLVLLTILAAFALGALHAIEPGHGKALLAFTLVGARATTRQAVTLAGSLTIAHTAGVLLLGLVLFFAAGFVSESIYPWITVASGIAIVIIGARSLARYVAMRRDSSHIHVHEHNGAHPHTHAHDHKYESEQVHGHGHTHAVPGSQPLNFRSAIVAAMSGGIAPCPAAIVVLLAALRLHQLSYGIVLIVVFSMGLATVLSGLGIGVVHGAAWLSRRSSFARVVEYGPMITAIVISTIGAWTLAQGFAQEGINAPAIVVAALTLLAIGGYALSNHHHHTHLQAPHSYVEGGPA